MLWHFYIQGLLLLEYMIRCGSDRVLQDARDHVYRLRSLMNFEYVDDHQVDQGVNSLCSMSSVGHHFCSTGKGEVHVRFHQR